MVLPESPIQPLKILEGQTNGRLSPDILVNIPGQAGGATVTLVKPAARAWRALCDVAKKNGHILKTALTWQSYRTYNQQVAVFKDHYTTTYIPGAQVRIWNGMKWYKRPGKSTAAVPGTSNHGRARAVDGGEERDGDVGQEPWDSTTLNWLKANAARFGFCWEIQSEAWHIVYFAGDVPPAAVLAWEKEQNGNFPDPEPPTPQPEPPQSDAPEGNEMFFARRGTESKIWFFEPGRMTHMKSRADMQEISTASNGNISVNEATLSPETFDVLAFGRAKAE